MITPLFLYLITFRDGEHYIAHLTEEDLYEVCFLVRAETILAINRLGPS